MPEQNGSGAPRLVVHPASVLEGQTVLLSGQGWGGCPVLLTLDGKRFRIARAALGTPMTRGVRPDPHGEFVVEIAVLDLRPGKHEVVAESTHETWKGRAAVSFEIRERPRLDEERGKGPREDDREEKLEEARDSPYWRKLDFFRRRFGHLGFIPPGVRQTQMEEILKLRGLRNRPSSMPLPGACNWTPLGPGPVVVGQGTSWSGRALSLAIDPTNPSTIYLGTAGGGVWKSLDGGTTWAPKSDYQSSLSIGTLAIDSFNPQRLFAGTGEYNNGGVGTYYGNGILRSTDGGETWSELGTTTFLRDEISRILFDPTDDTSQKMFLAAATGVYTSTDGGVNWTLQRAGSVGSLVVVVNGASLRLIAGFRGSGLWTSTRAGVLWSAWTQLTSPAFPTGGIDRIALGQSRNHPQTIYAAFSDGSSIAGLARTTNGGADWTLVTPPLALDIVKTSSEFGAPAHTHGVTVPAADLDGPAAAHVYATAPGGGHSHTISLTAAEMQTLRGGGVVNKTTQADGTGHQHTFVLDRRVSGQTWYNLHITPHPTSPDTVYYGDVQLWKTTTGNGPWTALPIQHTDQHAFAFDPLNPETVWAANDGGVYRSFDGGATWEHRNRDLQTLEYISLALHPQYESVILGGTQDNGTQRYEGSPAWILSADGDGGFTAIDPAVPTRMYHQYIYSTFYRSDSAGAPGTWALKNDGITGEAEFYAPFALDPSAPDTCYFGGRRLWRSANNADSWAAVTNDLLGNITAIAVHPTSSLTVWVGTTEGRVYQVRRSGPTWDLADVTTTDFTGADLPAGSYVSDLAIDSASTVWVTMSSLQWTESVELFNADHVFRRTSASSVWESRSNGLAQANPINCIVIDPTNNDRLFCGGDIGVFRTEDAGGTWTLWDEGLPNVPVFDMALHGPSRLLRVATHGRSLWERPVDTPTCPMVDLYLRDNILDTGRRLPSPEGTPHPFDPTRNAWHWQSEDVKVDGPEPSFQTATPVDNYVDFTLLAHRTVRRERTNRFYALVHNRGIGKATNVVVRAFFAAASPGLPPLPADFWSGGKPFSGTPGGTDWTPVGPARILPELAPGEPGIAAWDWFVPASAPQHSCLLVVATCTEDPLDGSGLLDPDQLVVSRKQVTLKNLQVEDALPGTPMGSQSGFQMWLHPSKGQDALRFELGNLPPRSRVLFAFAASGEERPVVTLSADRLKRLGINPARDAAEVFPREVEGGCGKIHAIDPAGVWEIAASERAGTVTLPDLQLARRGATLLLVKVELPEKTRRGTYELDVLLVRGQRTVGGNTLQLRVGGD